MILLAPAAGVLNQYAYNEADGQSGQSNATGYTLSDATISEKTLVVLVIGQSNGANDRPTKYTVANSTKLRMINPYNGSAYRLKDQQLGPNGANGNRYTKVFDTVISNGTGGFGSVIVQNISRSGSGSRLWRGYRLSPGTNFQNAQVAVKRTRALGLYVPNANVEHVVWINFGETDKANSVTTAEWIANVQDLRAGLLDVGLPASAKWFINKETYENSGTSTDVQNAQTGIIDNVTYFAGANCDQYTSATYRRGDGTHLTDTGHDTIAAAEVTALDAVY